MTNLLRGKVDRQYSIAEVAEMRRRNALIMAPRFDAHILEYERYDHDLFQLGIVALKAKRPAPPRTRAQKEAFKNIMKGLKFGPGGNTLKYIVRQQNFGRATNWSPVRTVRG